MEMEQAAQPPREEAVYVVLDLEQGVDALPPPGSRLQLQGMDTLQPSLLLPDGTRLVGAFQETVGTQLVLADTVTADGSHRVELVGHTDKRITFARPQPEAEAADSEGAAGREAAAAEGAPPA